MAIARQQMTLKQFLRLPQEEPALEYWHGEVTQKVASKLPHGALQSSIAERVRQAAGPNRPVRAFTETRITFADVLPGLRLHVGSMLDGDLSAVLTHLSRTP